MALQAEISKAQTRRGELSSGLHKLQTALTDHRAAVDERVKKDALDRKAYPDKARESDRQKGRDLEQQIAEAERSIEFVDEHLADLSRAKEHEEAEAVLTEITQVATGAGKAFERFVEHWEKARAAFREIVEAHSEHTRRVHGLRESGRRELLGLGGTALPAPARFPVQLPLLRRELSDAITSKHPNVPPCRNWKPLGVERVTKV